MLLISNLWPLIFYINENKFIFRCYFSTHVNLSVVVKPPLIKMLTSWSIALFLVFVSTLIITRHLKFVSTSIHLLLIILCWFVHYIASLLKQSFLGGLKLILYIAKLMNYEICLQILLRKWLKAASVIHLWEWYRWRKLLNFNESFAYLVYRKQFFSFEMFT